MRNYFLISLFYFFSLSFLIVFPYSASAQMQSSDAANASTSSKSVNTMNQAEEADPLNTGSYADAAALGQEIALAQRKIQAMTLKNSLDALEAQQSMGTISLKVLRVEGFDNSLYAILLDENNVVYQVGPGDMINKKYKVTLIRPYSVGVMDIKTQKFYTLPFFTGRMGVNDSSNDRPPVNSSSSSS